MPILKEKFAVNLKFNFTGHSVLFIYIFILFSPDNTFKGRMYWKSYSFKMLYIKLYLKMCVTDPITC